MQAAQQSKPWYKEPWTWLLMLMPATAIVAGFITLWLAIKSFDGLVADDYYKQGLAINQTLAKVIAARENGLVGVVRFSAENIVVELRAKPGIELPTRLLFTLAHPTKGGLDQQFFLERRDDGRYLGVVTAAIASAHWKVLLEDEAQSWRLSGTAFLPTVTELKMDAADVKPVD
ncbi:FixH family protein [Zoogloea sp.]|uniref:FixH family protein n=1 Tax=Zoogloea sp. TaxID=49181 RepID=UPI0035AF9291